MKIKVIFLDFDGVINGSDPTPNASFGEGWPFTHIEASLVEKINKIVETVEAQDAEQGIKTKIVISSSWRIRFSLNELRDMLQIKGLRADVIDITPRIHPRKFSEHVPRGQEIQSWLNSCQADCYYSVVKFVILDDISDMIHLTPYLIETDDRTGITDSDVERAIELLKG
ncbi:hypothetical protein E6Q11_02345 [Candidatus Dojkabacteria bacterium]|uniref:Uncharacterized protein n=1 Tax=Candidatus Dojkabacteria bacterium TaxID=2099670 RepID=A0A5C7J861_9BACT|nr:MAG: hypothetical protein E6Q11_02345 [Candidatus Dojkabacteria bacterium]